MQTSPSSPNPVASALMSAVGDDGPLATVLPGTTGLDSRSRTEELALGAVTFCASQATRFLGREVTVDPTRVGAAFRSFTHFRLDGVGVDGFDPLSGFFATSDGWVRTHANYPWHRERLATVLGLGGSPTREAVAAAVVERGAQELEDAVTAAGGLCRRVRTTEEFAAVPGMADARLLRSAPTAVAQRRGGESAPVRVLDLTRVIAGPVATRTLASLGMDVLRIDPTHLPEIAAQHLDSGAGKRSAAVDLGINRRLVSDLVASADVVVSGYRPGSLSRLGLDPESLLEQRPDLVVATIRAWPEASAWSHRRGFDSIVQAASGIADVERADDGTPGALRAQALDHSCGYLLAGGILAALAAGHGGRVATSLTGAARALLALGQGDPSGEPLVPAADAAHVETVDSAAGRVTRVRSVFEVDGVDAHVEPLGASDPVWRTVPTPA